MNTLNPQYDSSKLLMYAVNQCLAAIGEMPVKDDIEMNEIAEAIMAQQYIFDAKKEILTEGWEVNSDENYTFPQDNQGIISIPQNVLGISSSQGNLIMREWKLYDKSEHSYIFEDPQTVDVRWDIEFNSLPHGIRNLITKKAIFDFAVDTIGDPSKTQVLKMRLDGAYDSARREEGFVGRFNIINDAAYSQYKVR